MTQDDIFLQSEGDQWFHRNKSHLAGEGYRAHDPIFTMLELVNIRPSNVLEIGASNGYRLHEIHTRYQCATTAVEPSQSAIADGQEAYPQIQFLRGTASQLPISDNFQFDLVIVHFVFHWIDRSTLLRSVAEIDRMLKDGGHLVIGDFHPPNPQRVAYHHLPAEQVWTYKQEYAHIFLASQTYAPVASFDFDHSNHQVGSNQPLNNRAHVSLIQKLLTERYQVVALKS
jgi:ubiquinone/menaquinone biosynthesis C-methylase UbiE